MKMINRLCCLILAVITIFASSCSPAFSAEAPDKSAQAFARMTDEYMEKVLKEYNVAGAAVSVVKDGKVFFKKGYGYADLGKRVPVDPDTTAFQIASVSKLFTATAAMQLVEQGKLSLNGDVNKYLSFKVKNPFSKPVTLENLLTHSAGFDDKAPLYVKSTGDKYFDSVEPLRTYLKRELPPIVREPETFTQYSVFGMALAGLLVEEVEGIPFDSYVTKNILEPLGMRNSSYGLNRDIIGKAAKPYRYSKGKFEDGAFRLISDHPSGSIYSSAGDMANFMLMQLGGGEFNGVRILSADSIQNMQRHHSPEDEKLPGFGLGFYEFMRNGHRTIEHGGYLPGTSSKLTLLPEDGLGMFIAINTDSRFSGKVCNEYTDMFYDFFTEKGVDMEAEAALATKVPLDLDTDKINGAYQFDTSGLRDLSKLKSVLVNSYVQCDKAGKLVFSVEGQKWDFQYVGQGRFYSRSDGMYCKLAERNGRMVLSILGMDYEKVKTADANLFKAAALGLPVMLAAIIAIIISLLRNRKSMEKREKRFKWSLLAACGLVIAYYILNVIMALKSMNADTWSVIYVITPMIYAVCYTALFSALGAWYRLINLWVKCKGSWWSRLLYSVALAAVSVNLLFMYVMNGFRLW